MKIKILSTNLSKCLSKVSNALPSNPIVPTLENFLFQIDEDHIKITATDLQTYLSAKVSILDIDCAVEERNFSIAVPAKILHETIKSLPEQVLDFHIDLDTYAVSIHSSNGVYRLIGESSQDFPEIRLSSQVACSSLELSSDLLKQIFSTVLVTMSKDDMRPNLNSVCIDINGEFIKFVSTDTFKLCKYQLNNMSFDKIESSFVLSRKSVMIILSIMNTDSNININFSSELFYGIIDGCSFSCRLVEGNFPGYDNAIPADNDKILQIGRLELLRSLKRIAIFANKATRYVSFNLGKGQLTLVAEDIDFSNAATETLLCEYDDEEISIGFNINAFIEILSTLKSDEIKIKFGTSATACLIVPRVSSESSENILILLMPVLLNSSRE